MGHHSGRPKKKGQPRRSQDSHGAARPEEGVVPKVDPIDESVKTLRDKILRLGEQFGIELGNVQQKLRETLLRDIEKLIVQDKVDEICSTQDIHLQNERAKVLADSVSKLIRARLSPLQVRRLRYAERDQLIMALTDKELTLAKIAEELRAKGMLQFSSPESDEQTVGSARKRWQEKEKVAMDLIQEINQLLDILSDALQDKKPKPR
jgi:vacuolar-type H+-ATPase subunit I/STV1